MSTLEDSYRGILSIPANHGFTLLSKDRKNSGDRDDEWFTFQETDAEGKDLATYNVASLQETYPPFKASNKITKTMPNGETVIIQDDER